jgi:cysteinyl-tRNA synthetase
MPQALHLNNTLSKKKELFRSMEEGSVKIFTCGPSVYRRAHIGNYRTFLYEDLLHRYLEYLGYRVQRVMNFTDVEDKAIAEAKNHGITAQELTTPVEDRFLKEVRMLRIKIPEIARSSTSVEQAVRLIRVLLDKGYAYRHDGDIFYDPLKFAGFGKLFGLDMSRWPKKKRRFRKDTYPGQRWNLGDFILWHGDKGEQDNPYWDTELGKGRPAWNVQDPAMVTKHLGYRIDIACGGADNLYRHHDYTIAVVEGVSGQPFASYWLHGEHVLVAGTKMSKSKGNILYPEDLLERGLTPGDIRFSLIYTHYRKKLDLTDAYLEKATGKLAAFKEAAKRLTNLATEPGSSTEPAEQLVSGIESAFKDRMNDDLDVEGAFEGIYGILSRLLSLNPEGRLGFTTSSLLSEHLQRIDGVLQVLD